MRITLYLAAFLVLCKKGDSVETTVSPQKENNEMDLCKKLTPSHGFSGIPGSNGMPGVPGVPGLQGQQGRDGEKGQTGDKGVQGLMGQKGDKGKQGSPGKSGAPGMTGIKGDKGDGGSRGIIGKPGEQGIKGLQGRKGDKGEKGESPTNVVLQSNWKQCVWKTSDSRDSGKIKDCLFNKLQADTAIKVSFQGNMRVIGDSRCSRWFFKFNSNECSGPMTIEAVVYNSWPSGNPNLLHHRSFEGYCENILQGKITVELWVGQCPSAGYTLGNAETGWSSVSRIMIEEVSRAQS